MKRSFLPIFLIFSLSACGGDDDGGGTADASTSPDASASSDASGPDAEACNAAATCSSIGGGGDPGSATWDPSVAAQSCAASALAIGALDDCACQQLSANGGCADICDGNMNGTGTANFCQGVGALPQCNACLQAMCGQQLTDCAAN